LSQQGTMTGEVSNALRRQIWMCRHPFLNRIRIWMRSPRRIKDVATATLRYMLPAPVRRWLRARVDGSAYVPPVGWVRFGSFRRKEPFSRLWGTERCLPIDRYYIEKFLSERSRDISGHVLEIGDNRYTRKFGSNKVDRSDVLHIAGNPQSTIVADLT